MNYLKVLSLLLASTAIEAGTKITVLELGKGGSVRRTVKDSTITSTVEGITSLWSEAHGHGGKGKKNMSSKSGSGLVADMFNKADGGIVMKLGKDVNVKKTIVGSLEVAGHQASHLLSKLKVHKIMDAADIKSIEEYSDVRDTLSALDLSTVKNVEKEVSAALKRLQKEAEEKDKTVVVYLMNEDNDMVSISRRLDEEEDGDDDANQNGNGFYGYYNDYGEWVTNYRTIFQIQYYNVVLWTTVGLFVLAYVSNVMLVNMPLMEDTLLFGESAKMAAS